MFGWLKYRTKFRSTGAMLLYIYISVTNLNYFDSFGKNLSKYGAEFVIGNCRLFLYKTAMLVFRIGISTIKLFSLVQNNTFEMTIIN